MHQFEDRCHNSMHSYVIVVSNYGYHGSNVLFLGVLLNYVVTGCMEDTETTLATCEEDLICGIGENTMAGTCGVEVVDDLGDECCVDDATWEDSYGDNCAKYAAEAWCDGSSIGDGWSESWGTLEAYADGDGNSAYDICCVCTDGAATCTSGTTECYTNTESGDNTCIPAGGQVGGDCSQGCADEGEFLYCSLLYFLAIASLFS